MAKTILYSVKRGGKWLQGIEANKNYTQNACAPTMGTRYTYSDFKTIWGNEQKYFEMLTLSDYLKILFQEYRWEIKKYMDIKIVPLLMEAQNE